MTLRRRTHIVIRGVVQGVGFRPFVYRLATALNLKGWVRNSTQGIFIDAEGDGTDIEEFLSRLPVERPPHSSIQSMESWHLDPCGYEKFEILPSEPDGKREALVLPDIATCPECIRDVFDPEDRRYRYPFTNCTHCGPRYSIIEAVPYDRQRTSMKEFSMCDECRAEYENPADRRFHAQPIACPACGPQLSLWNSVGETMASRYQALLNAVQLIRDGGILALKGLGGFQLVVRADSDDAVRDLRRKKHREEKPFAVMAPALQWARHECHVTTLEVRMLTAPESPIVLLERRRNTVSSLVAPDNPNLGVMLPYTPLHHLLMNECRIPVVATSGNISDEPLCIDEREALERLSGIADAYLVHERPIVRHVDDSVVRVMNDREIVLRRARGFAPLPITLPWDFPDAVAVGAHLKNTVAVSRGSNIFISQHIGDLETQQSIMAFQKTVADLGRLLNIEPTMVVSDLHPDYLSTAHASNSRLPMKRVQHHHAHVASCMADNHLSGNALGISWDGTGFGTDATIWGGEFLMVSGHAYERVATFHPFPLPGGEQAIRQPRRIALSLLEESVGLGHAGDLDVLKVFSPEEVRVLRQMMSSRINSPLTSSVGRLFDGVAALLGVLSEARYEGQAAMRLEYSIIPDEEIYPFEVERPGDLPAHVMWSPMIRAIVEDVRRGIAPGRIAARFHNTLVETIIHVARSVEERRVMLTGGCFQNKYLTERSISRLIAEGFVPYWHQRVPPNDGGISLGQLCVLAGVPSDRHVPTHSVEVAVESGVW